MPSVVQCTLFVTLRCYYNKSIYYRCKNILVVLWQSGCMAYFTTVRVTPTHQFWVRFGFAFQEIGCSKLAIHFLRSSLCPYPLLCWPHWRCQWSCECHCELDTEWWRQCWFLPHRHYHQCSTDPLWRTSEYHHCQCHTASTDWFHGRLWVQHHSTWCQLWESGGKWEWTSDNQTSRHYFQL